MKNETNGTIFVHLKLTLLLALMTPLMVSTAHAARKPRRQLVCADLTGPVSEGRSEPTAPRLQEMVVNPFQAMGMSKEITNSDIAQHLTAQAQRRYLTEEQIQTVVNTFSKEQRELVLEIFKTLSQWALPSQFQRLEEGMSAVARKTSGTALLTPTYLLRFPDGSSFAPVFSYLNGKSDTPLKTTFTLDPPNVAAKEAKYNFVLLEPAFFSRIRRDPDYLALLVRSGTQFIYPEGLFEGLNFVTYLSDSEKLIAKISHVLKLKNKNPKLSVAELLYSEATREILDRYPFLKSSIHKISNVSTDKVTDVSGLLKLLRPEGVSEKTIAELVENFAGDFKSVKATELLPAFRSLLLQSEIISYPEMMHQMRGLLQKISAAAESKGYRKKDIYLVVPAFTKSYAMVTYLAAAEGTFLPQNIHSNSYNEVVTGPDPIATAIIDDYSGTGSSLSAKMDWGYLRSENPELDFRIVSAVYVTKRVDERFKVVNSSNTNAAMFIWQKMSETTLPEGMAALNSAISVAWQKLSGGSFSDTGSTIALPYMGPDNNYALFSKYIASLFLPKKAIKNATYSASPVALGDNTPTMSPDYVLSAPTMKKALHFLKGTGWDPARSKLVKPEIPRIVSLNGKKLHVQRKLWETSQHFLLSTYKNQDLWIPKDAQSSGLIALEKQLRADFSPMEGVKEIMYPVANDNFLPKGIVADQLFPKRTLYSMLANNSLSPAQKEALQSSWRLSKTVAQATGMPLDMDSRNIIWNPKVEKWQLIRFLPRLDKVPYCFSLDTKDFEDFLIFAFDPSLCTEIKKPLTFEFVFQWLANERRR